MNSASTRSQTADQDISYYAASDCASKNTQDAVGTFRPCVAYCYDQRYDDCCDYPDHFLLPSIRGKINPARIAAIAAAKPPAMVPP